MTDEELLAELKKLLGDDVAYCEPFMSWNYDPVHSHHMADILLVQLLRDLGYNKAMDFYTEQTRWYG